MRHTVMRRDLGRCEAQGGFRYGGAACPEQLLAPKNACCSGRVRLQVRSTAARWIVGDGTAQLLCHDTDAQREVCRILEAQFDVHCMTMTLFPTTDKGDVLNKLPRNCILVICKHCMTMTTCKFSLLSACTITD
jgi:hypothetical protein